MKFFRWFCVFTFFLCICATFIQKPFQFEMPILLLPSIHTDTTIQHNTLTICNDFFDSRPDCIQTEKNFSKYHPIDFKKEYTIIEYMRTQLTKSANILFSGRESPYTSIEKSTPHGVAWFFRKPKPIRSTTTQQNKNSALSSGSNEYLSPYSLIGENQLPCSIL